MRKPKRGKPSPAQVKRFGPRGGKQFRVNAPGGGGGAAGIAEAISGLRRSGGGFGRGLFFLLIGGFVLYLIVSKHFVGVWQAIQGKGALKPPGHKHIGKKVGH